MIILDPPPLRNRRARWRALCAGTKEINLRTVWRLALLGKVLATYSCSHHMQDADLRGVLARPPPMSGARVTVLEWSHQPPDHPAVLATMPEGEYLQGYILRRGVKPAAGPRLPP